eukprot:TRINITY_DN21853_c0_g1_i2.p1 TRINITY_DN21853_c0_g1~~TRINITY_DN21853_c0_g1_i2.p1  ORF type:complete len:226 (+),score=47.29 TRINITY_DN21853_c0_g1_i2:3-680(+)
MAASDSADEVAESSADSGSESGSEAAGSAAGAAAAALPPHILAALRPPDSDGPASAFEKLSCLGEGGYGAVWLARRKADGLYVALKEVSRLRLCGSDDDVRRLWDERRALGCVADARAAEDEDGGAGAVSPVLVGLVASYATPLALHLVMDLVEGAPLHLHLRRGLGPPGVLASRLLAAELASALAWLHRRGWLYRDLKLSNVARACSSMLAGPHRGAHWPRTPR